MFVAQLLIEKSATYSIFSPWFPRQGDNMIVTADVAELDGGSFTLQVFTKDSETPGDGTQVGSDKTVNAAGQASETITGLNELVRYKYNVDNTQSGDWILFRMLPPVWYDTV